MDKKCEECGETFKVKPSKFKTKRHCSRECYTKKVTRPCDTCGNDVTRVPSQMLKEVYCNMACAAIGKRIRFNKMNEARIGTPLSLEHRLKLREYRLGKGEGKGYEKTLGVHTHRLVAAEKIGRPLKKGEVVHHKDNVKRNNNPDNLEVLASQSEHCKIHGFPHNMNNKRK